MHCKEKLAVCPKRSSSKKFKKSHLRWEEQQKEIHFSYSVPGELVFCEIFCLGILVQKNYFLPSMFKQIARCYIEGKVWEKGRGTFCQAARGIFILLTLSPEAPHKWSWWTNTWDTATPGNTPERSLCISWRQCQRSHLQILQALASKPLKKTKSNAITALPALKKKQMAATKNTSCCFPSPLFFSWSAKRDLGEREGKMWRCVWARCCGWELPRPQRSSRSIRGALGRAAPSLLSLLGMSHCCPYKGPARQRSSLKKVTRRSWWSQTF